SAAVFQPFPVLAGDRAGPRQTLRHEVDRSTLQQSAPMQSFDRFYERAFSLVGSAAARRAFDLGQEAPVTRDRYGWSPFGQASLLARRLVEAGVPLVTVNWQRNDAYWDTHDRNFQQLKDTLLPPFDRGFSALLEDLNQRGLLD